MVLPQPKSSTYYVGMTCNLSLPALPQASADAYSCSQPKLSLVRSKDKDCFLSETSGSLAAPYLYHYATVVQLLTSTGSAAIPSCLCRCLVTFYRCYHKCLLVSRIVHRTHSLLCILTRVLPLVDISNGDEGWLHLAKTPDHPQPKRAVLL